MHPLRSEEAAASSSKPALSLKEKAYAHIQRKIVAGDMPAGTPLSEVSLAKEIGISRTPVREAIGQLQAEGFLEQIPGRGTVVRRLNRSDLIELYELREALEVYSVGKLAQQGLTDEFLSDLQQSCDRLLSISSDLEKSGQRRLDQSQMERFLGIDLHFHSLLLRAAANNRIVKVARDTRLLIQILGMRHESHDLAQLGGIHRFHQEILDSIAASDAVHATRLMTDHIRLSRQERLEEYDRWERSARMSQVDSWIDYYHVLDES
jgi:DNA-binding GntR family transcriptional regulator